MRTAMTTGLLRAATVLAMLIASACMLRAQNAPRAVASTRDQRTVTVAIATRALAAGEALADSDMTLRDTVIVWRWNTAPDTTRPAAGWVTRRAIAAGEVLKSPAVVPPPVVTSGAAVTAIWQDGPVRLVLSGTATNSAAIGAPVGVRIDRTRRLDGIAIAPNTVRLR